MDDDDAMSVASMASQLSNFSTAEQRAAQNIANGMRRSRENGDKEMNARKRTQRRVLTPLPSIGVCGVQGGLALRVQALHTMRRPWYQREDMKRAGTGRVVNFSPFGDDDTYDWAFNPRTQLDFAEKFHIPLFLDMPCRVLSSDTVAPAEIVKNRASKLLFAAINAHVPSGLDTSLTHHITETFLPQHHCDLFSQHALYGVNGGKCGTDETCFWDVAISDGTQTVNPDFLRFVTMLLCGLAGGFDPVWSAVNTEYTHLAINQHRKSIDGACYSVERHDDAIFRDVDFDFDEELLQRIASVRGLDDVADVVPGMRRYKSFSNKHGIVSKTDVVYETSIKNLFQAVLHMDIIPCQDARGQKQSIKQCVLRIVTLIPGVDVCVAVKNVFANAQRRFQSVWACSSLILRRMANDLKWTAEVSAASLFSTESVYNLASLTADANPPLVVFFLAARHKLVNVAVGGMRMDVANDIDAYMAYARTVYRNRTQHYQRVLRYITEDQQPGGLRQCVKPVDDFPLHANVSMHYRSVPAQYLREWLADIRRSDAEEQGAQDSASFHAHRDDEEASLWNSLLCTERHSGPEDLVFFAVGGSVVNYGVAMKLNIDSLSTVAESLRFKTDILLSDVLPQPARVSSLAGAYLRARAQETDPFDDFFRIADPLVMDLETLCKMPQVPVHVVMLRKKMKQSIDEHLRSTNSNTVVKDAHILQLYGKVENPMVEQVREVEKHSNVEDMAEAWDSVFMAGFFEAIELMSTGPLMHFAAAANSVLDLKHQGREYAQEYVEESIRKRQQTRALGVCMSMANDEVGVSLWTERLRERLKLGISWSNHHLQDGISRSAVGFFCKQEACWGATIWISDCGQSVQILAETNNKQMQEKREATFYDAKAPGMGIDAVNDSLGLISNAYGTYLAGSSALRSFYASPVARDVKTQWASSLSLATMWGCGVKKDGNGNIDEESRSFMLEAGVGGIFTEMLKVNADSDAALNAAANIESNLADSAKGEGMRQVPWQSTEKQKSTTYEQLFNGIPLWCMCSNRFNRRQPVSMKEGGRIQYYNTSVMDGKNGVLEFKEQQSQLHVLGVSNVVVSNDEFGDNNSGCLEGDMRYMNNFSGDFRAPIEGVTSVLAHKNRLYFLMRHLLRKSWPLLHRTMTVGFKAQTFSFHTHNEALYNNAMRLTRNVRRPWLDDKDDTRFRTFYGPYITATAMPVWIQNTLWRNVCQKIMLVPFGSQYHLNADVDLVGAVADSLKATTTAPPSLHSHLDAMYKWFVTSVLDVGVMVLSCFCLSMMGFCGHCPLVVVAKVINGVPMTVLEEEQYETLCEFMLPIVTVPGGASETRGAQALFSDNRKKKITHLIPQKCMQEPTEELLRKWFRASESGSGDNHSGDAFNDEGGVDRLLSDNETRMGGVPSIYIRPSIDIVDSNAKWCATHEHVMNRKGARRFADEYVSDSVTSVLANSFAVQQTDAAHQDRIRANNLPEHQHTTAFWHAAHAGTRLPMPHRVSRKQDRSMCAFQAVWETGFWFVDTMETLAGATGPVRQFLLMCHLPQKTSRLDLMKRILNPYIVKRNMRRIYCTTPEWKEPILSLDAKSKKELISARPALAFGSCMHVKKKQNCNSAEADGVDVAMGMDVVWFLVAQGLYCAEWNKTSVGHKIVVHLRNLGSAAKELLHMFVHTMVEKSAVPPSPIFISSPSHTVGYTLPAVDLHFDHRLHVDSFLPNNTYAERSFLSTTSRRSSNFVRTQTCDMGVQYVYGNVSARRKSLEDVNTYDLFPFAPESVSHMSSTIHTIKMVIRRFCIQHNTNTIDLPVALRLYGCNMFMKHVSYQASALTHMLTLDGMEIPCVTYRNGFVFVLKMVRNKYQVIPVAMDGFFEPHIDGVTDYCKFEPLPLNDTKPLIQPDEVGFFMTQGIVFDEAERTASVRRPHSSISESELIFPATFMPIFPWEQLTVFDAPSYVTVMQDGSEVRLVGARNEFRRQDDYFLDGENIARWKKYNVQEARMAEKVGDKWELNVVDLMGLYVSNEDDGCDILVGDDIPTYWIECTDTSSVFFIPDTVSLHKALDGLCSGGTNPYEAMYPADCKHVESTLLACNDRHHSQDKSSFYAMPILYSEQHGLHCRQMQDGTENIMCMKGSAKLETMPLPEPFDIARTDRESRLGLLRPHDKAGHFFLQNGKYRMEFVTNHMSLVAHIDFINITRMAVREGRPLFIELSHQMLAGICVDYPQMCLDDVDVHVRYLSDMMDGHEVTRPVMLRSYYVLGVNAKHDVAIGDATIQVLVEVTKRGIDQIVSTQTITMWVRLYDNEGVAIVRTQSPKGYFVAQSLSLRDEKYIKSGFPQTMSSYLEEHPLDGRFMGIVGQPSPPPQ